MIVELGHYCLALVFIWTIFQLSSDFWYKFDKLIKSFILKFSARALGCISISLISISFKNFFNELRIVFRLCENASFTINEKLLSLSRLYFGFGKGVIFIIAESTFGLG